MEATKITIKADVAAEVQKVWKYWNEVEHVTRWNAASEDWHCPGGTNDLRTGGKFSFTMAAKDGSMSFDFEGIYDVVEPGRKLEYTLGDGRKVWIDFEDRGNHTFITETFEAEGTHPAEMQEAGWQSILNNFKTYTESN